MRQASRPQLGTSAGVKTLLIAAAILLLFGTVAPASAADALAGGDLAKLEPALADALRGNPSANFRVIVQRTPTRGKSEFRAQESEVERALQVEGGRSHGRLGIVGGHVATLNGRAILRLSRLPRVRSISLDHAVALQTLQSLETITANAPAAWSTYADTGAGVTVAVLDSGVLASPDLPNAVFGVDVVTGTTALGDGGGHGSHTAGIVAGNGAQSGGNYQGVAPGARVLSVKVTTDDGHAAYSTVIAGLQWVVSNARTYNIRVVNLSLGATASTPYADDPLNGAAEVAWFRGIVVVAAAGNTGPGPGTINVPANDPFVISVGAYDDSQTAPYADDLLPDWTSRGPTPYDGIQKPDLVASGRRVISLRSPGSYLDQTMPERVVDTSYFRLSGTSMAAPGVAGAAALVLGANPALSPNQVKYIVKQSARPLPYDANSVGAGAVDALAAVRLARQGIGGEKANKGQTPNKNTATAVWSVVKTMVPVWRNKGVWQGRTWVDGSWVGSGFQHTDGTWDDGTWDATAWANFAWEDGTWDSASWDAFAWADGTWDTVSGLDGTWDMGGWTRTVRD